MTGRPLVWAVLLCVAAAGLGVGYWAWVESHRIYGGPLSESLDVRNVGWDLARARADFNATATAVWRQEGITLDHVEVNGTRVDAYPEDSSLMLGETTLVRVYYPYEAGVTYVFIFFTEWEHEYHCVAQAPIE